jgi:hypothetical protein
MQANSTNHNRFLLLIQPLRGPNGSHLRHNPSSLLPGINKDQLGHPHIPTPRAGILIMARLDLWCRRLAQPPVQPYQCPASLLSRQRPNSIIKPPT